MPYLAVNEDGIEAIFDMETGGDGLKYETDSVILPSGTIRKLIGRDLTWQDEPVELTEEMVEEPEKPDYYAGIEWVNDWAKYRAIDANGEIWEYSDVPIINLRRWLLMGGGTIHKVSRVEKMLRVFDDWQSTLQERTTK